MPRLPRPDGVELYWEERGDGPLVLLVIPFFGFPETFDLLVGELETDHRVVTYHLRGTGESTHSGPYDFETDVQDLAALIEELGQPAILVPFGDGTVRAVRTAALRPELVSAVISPGGNPVGRLAAEGTESLAGSASVIEALVGLMEADYRAALRTMLDTANPQFDDEELRERLNRTADHSPREAALPRLREWVVADATEDARALGDRLWLLEHGNNPWFPIEVARRSRRLLPEAHIEEVEDGPLSRPDITAGFVRRASHSAAMSQRSSAE
jgi:pimeloyl-ACP methyl ester carboxylesterase